MRPYNNLIQESFPSNFPGSEYNLEHLFDLAPLFSQRLPGQHLGMHLPLLGALGALFIRGLPDTALPTSAGKHDIHKSWSDPKPL